MPKVFLMGVLILASAANLLAEEEEFCWGPRDSFQQQTANPNAKPGNLVLAIALRVFSQLEELEEAPLPKSVPVELFASFKKLKDDFLKVIASAHARNDFSRALHKEFRAAFEQLSKFNGVLEQYLDSPATEGIAKEIFTLRNRYELWSQ